jgi:structural maintenance of chromosome 1
MDIDNEDSTQQPAAVKDYDLEISFDDLDEDDREVRSDECWLE